MGLCKMQSTPLFCRADRKLIAEVFQFLECCQRGLVTPPFPNDPQLMHYHLPAGPKIFRKGISPNIRSYNNSLAASCLKADLDSHASENSSFNPTMTIHGRIYHFLGATIPPFDLQPSFCPCTFTTLTMLQKATYGQLTYSV